MIRFYVRCEVCGESVFDPGQVISYQIQLVPKRRLEVVALGNRSGPWAGVRCVCLSCVKFLVESVLPGVTVDIPQKPQDDPGTIPPDIPV